MSLSKDADGDWRVSFETDFEQFEIVVSHEMVQSSYSLFQVQAFKEAMSISEPGDKMDESIFLQHCARLQSKFNLVKTYRSGARLGAYVKPSSIPASQAKVELKCAVAIPPLASGELDWSFSTKRRLGLDNAMPVNNDRDSVGGMRYSEASAAEALRILMAMAQTAADQKGGLTPFQEERKGEEQAIQIGLMQRQEVVCLMTYGFRDDGDFASILVSGREPDVKFCFIVSVEDKQNLSWKEAQAIRLVVKLGERGTKINTNDFKGWAPQLDNKYASARYSHTGNQRLISINPGDARRSFPPGHVQQMVYVKKDADDDFIFAFQTDVNEYCVIVSHVIQNGSFSKWQGKALVDVLEYFETGNKLDDTIFMQCCARMNHGNNIVLVQCRDGILIAHIIPTTLTEQQARLNTRGQDFMTLPPVHDRKLDWDEATKDRLRAARGGSALVDNSVGSSPGRPTLVDDSMPVYGDGMVTAHRLLKNSGQADVYSGIRKKNKGNEQRVAIKVYKQEQDWKDCKDEIITLLKISGHRNVMEVLDFYEKPKPCVVMRLVDGGDLRDYLDRNGGMEWKLANKVLSGIASGLHHLHEHRMVHRDLKLPNILLEMPSLEPVLIDMGLGQTMNNESKSLVDTDGMKGTVLWMAPEMISDNKWNTKTDIYALGIIMWEIMTGKVPYIDQGLGIAQVLLAVVNKQTRPTISAVAGKMEPTMVQLMERAWHQDHSQRPTAAEFLMAINRCSTDNYTAKG
mmetsp:Transcript_6558/g.11016  ORF Transcript_6558/g.11016 Transcript_6558/m.11016 type:complete len:742 (+) Transcript_6558:826-3051(+)